MTDESQRNGMHPLEIKRKNETEIPGMENLSICSTQEMRDGTLSMIQTLSIQISPLHLLWSQRVQRTTRLTISLINPAHKLTQTADNGWQWVSWLPKNAISELCLGHWKFSSEGNTETIERKDLGEYDHYCQLLNPLRDNKAYGFLWLNYCGIESISLIVTVRGKQWAFLIRSNQLFREKETRKC